jgi:hypothetical protein
VVSPSSGSTSPSGKILNLLRFVASSMSSSQKPSSSMSSSSMPSSSLMSAMMDLYFGREESSMKSVLIAAH